MPSFPYTALKSLEEPTDAALVEQLVPLVSPMFDCSEIDCRRAFLADSISITISLRVLTTERASIFTGLNAMLVGSSVAS